MKVEIDQSGKLEQLDTLTVIAYANGKSGAIQITAATKRGLIQKIRRILIPRDEIGAVLFAVLIFIMIKDLPGNVTLMIDEEYTGKNRIIQEILLRLLERKFKSWNGNIEFGNIGKHSPAHLLAWKLHKKRKGLEIRKISEKEVLGFVTK